MDEDAFFRKRILLSAVIPALFVGLMWLIKVTEVLWQIDLSGFGIYPLELKGLPGILFSPFIHAGFRHLFNNSIPLFFLGLFLFYFYSDIAVKVFAWTFLITGLLVWIAGRSAWHIGASGIIYGLASFLFFSGIIRKHFRLMALSLLIVFLYGSMVWGIFPGIYENVSWESHMLGFISGIILTLVFRNEYPYTEVHEWMNEEDEDELSFDEPGKNGDNVKNN